MGNLAELRSVVSTSLHSYQRKMHDNIFKKSVLPAILKQKGAVKPVGGGLTLIADVEFAKNPTVGIRGARKSIPMQDYDPIAQVSFPWCTIDGSITLWDEDEWLNRAEGRLLPFAGSLISNTEKTFVDVMAPLYYSDGVVADGSPGFWGLEKMFSASNTYGNILQKDGSWAALDRSSADYSWWRAQVDTTDMAFCVEGDNGLRHNYNNGCQGDQSEFADLIVVPQSIFEAYVDSLTPQQRFQDADLVKLGFKNVMFENARMVWDINCPYVDAGGGHYHGTIYITNTNHLYIQPFAPCANRLMEKDWHQLEGTLAVVKTLVWRGQITCHNPRYQVKMTQRSVS